jgi:hypothetical protein
MVAGSCRGHLQGAAHSGTLGAAPSEPEMMPYRIGSASKSTVPYRYSGARLLTEPLAVGPCERLSTRPSRPKSDSAPPATLNHWRDVLLSVAGSRDPTGRGPCAAGPSQQGLERMEPFKACQIVVFCRPFYRTPHPASLYGRPLCRTARFIPPRSSVAMLCRSAILSRTGSRSSLSLAAANDPDGITHGACDGSPELRAHGPNGAVRTTHRRR